MDKGKVWTIYTYICATLFKGACFCFGRCFFIWMLISDIFADTALNICILLYIYIYNMHFLAVIVPEIEMVTS